MNFCQGHNKPITALTVTTDRNTIYRGSHDGCVTYWNTVSGESDRVHGTGHGNQINGMKSASNLVYTAGIDDTLRIIDTTTNSYLNTHVLKLDSQPKGLDVDGEIAIVVSIRQVGNAIHSKYLYT